MISVLMNGLTIEQYEMWWEHVADRSIWEMEHVCRKGKCVICNMGFTAFSE